MAVCRRRIIMFIVNILLFDIIQTVVDFLMQFQKPRTYTEQKKKKRNNCIPLNFEQTMIQTECFAFSTSALDIWLPNARNRFSV